MVAITGDNGARKPNGQFAKGHPGGPGRPPKDREAEADLYAVLQGCITADDMRQIVMKHRELAKRGNLGSTKLLFSYLLGDPEQYVNVQHSGSVGVIWDWEIPKEANT